MDDAGDARKIIKDGPGVGEGFTDVERDGEMKVKSELKHTLEKLNLGATVVAVVMIIEADLADGNRARGLRKIKFILTPVAGVLRMNAVSPVNIIVRRGEVSGSGGVFRVGADDDDFADITFGGFLKDSLRLLGREKFLVMEMAVSVDEIMIRHRYIII